MYIIVRLLKGFREPLWYKVPEHLSALKQKLVGQVILVPLRTQELQGLILKVQESRPKTKFKLKEAIDLLPFPRDINYKSFIEKIAPFYFQKPLYFYTRLRLFLEQKAGVPVKVGTLHSQGLLDPPGSKSGAGLTSPGRQTVLTDEQESAVTGITPSIIDPQYNPVLLHGVTGSGKTEVYKQLIVTAINNKKSVLFLLPEVSLSRQFEKRLRNQLPDTIKIYRFDSQATPKQKRELWELLLSGSPVLILGVHLPVFLPINNLGLIIIDEEHETGFSEKKHPKINSKHAALWRARHYKIPIVLGSATPSVSTLAQAQKDNWSVFKLTKRFAGQMPEIKHVLLTKARRKYFWFSPELIKNLEETLNNKKQAIIYINRRGFSFFAQCKLCGFIFSCPDCSVSLTVHESTGREQLTCHYCGFNCQLPEECEECKAPAKELKQRGIGTQQVVKLLEKIFPHARVARADTDISRTKKKWDETVEKFAAQEIDILVGTQIITKGYDFPGVTLVGLIWADSSLHFPVYNAHETALQQMLQVAGRAGRRDGDRARVIIQSFDDHEVFQYLSEEKYTEFAEHELENRAQLGYPPAGRLLTIELKHENPTILDRDASKLAKFLREHALDAGPVKVPAAAALSISVLGPAKPPVYKIQKVHVRHIMLKGERYTELYKLVRTIDLELFEVSLNFTPG